MPERAVYVGRPTIYGNPFSWADTATENVQMFQEWWDKRGWVHGTAMYEDQMDMLMGAMFQTEPHPLRGKDLACWCPLVDKDGRPVPCHADVLLKIANPE